jgi:Flp pilus assembly protein TadB
MRMRSSPRATRITDAAPSRNEQLRHREVRYVTMMSLRIICLILIVVFVSIHAPLVWLWVPVLLFGMFIVPWLAVILANDRPPKRRTRGIGQPNHPEQRALTPREPEPERRVIDIDP